MRIFEYAVLLHPTKDEEKAGETSKLIVSITPVLAKDQTQAQILAARSIPEEHLAALDRIEVACRPF